MGRLKSDQGQLFSEFHLTTRFPKIIWCGRSMLLSIFAARRRLIVAARFRRLSRR